MSLSASPLLRCDDDHAPRDDVRLFGHRLDRMPLRLENLARGLVDPPFLRLPIAWMIALLAHFALP